VTDPVAAIHPGIRAVMVTAETPGGTAQEGADWSARVASSLKNLPGFIVHVDEPK
jgi:hypothetical protein